MTDTELRSALLQFQRKYGTSITFFAISVEFLENILVDGLIITLTLFRQRLKKKNEIN